MAEQTQTERLLQNIRDIIALYHNQVPFADEVPEILKICKEAGLKFVYDIQAPAFGKQWAKFGEIEI